ncbi:sensor histidine kinase [Sciscionella sediminilitoris]|uniref:sensor histidine kinase n=1 Tax=Sciscionella sediminilitoris TaxID=1445613 RepID=UPI00055C3D24|nr:ATP-binding protein [Sciscionella sp. SE31]
MTTAATVLAILAAFVLGLAIGAVLRGKRRRRQRPQQHGPTVADLVHEVVQSGHNGVVVLGEFGDVLLHNTRAAELGVVTDNRVDSSARTTAERVARTGVTEQVDLTPQVPQAGRAPQAVLGEVRRLLDGFTVIDVADQSDTVRLEATRRDFVANVSHELKTPVGAMALLAEALLDYVDDPAEVHRFAGKILDESNRLGRLVNELISLSRLQGAERLPELQTVKVDEVVHEALHRAALAAESHQITMTTDEDSGLTVDGDHSLLATALANLLDNAIAYSPEGSGVSISRRESGGYVEIAVTDRGIGIAREHQERVFERFYRVDKARSRATGGTGLGLAIVKHVAANHGGSVRLWSQQGTGSTFTIRIPAVPVQPPAPVQLAEHEGAL